MELHEITPGPAIWVHEPRGGYGYQIRVLCDVVRVLTRRVKIRALRKGGGYDEIVVTPERIERCNELDEMRRAIWDEKHGTTLPAPESR